MEMRAVLSNSRVIFHLYNELCLKDGMLEAADGMCLVVVLKWPRLGSPGDKSVSLSDVGCLLLWSTRLTTLFGICRLLLPLRVCELKKVQLFFKNSTNFKLNSRM